MKRQTRPFSIEIKTSRKSTLPLRGAARPHDRWIDPFPDEVPERDVHDDVVLDEKSDALRQAEQLFARASGPKQHRDAAAVTVRPAPVTAEIAVAAPPQGASRTPRVLPDLLAQARDDERQSQERFDLEERRHEPARKRSPAGAKPKRSRKPRLPVSAELPLQSPPAPQAIPVVSVPVTALPSPVTDDTPALRSERRSGALPLGQRWKERRLPRVCWEQRGLRKRRRG